MFTYTQRLRYVFALSYNVLTLWRNVIASISYRFDHIGAVIASYSNRSKLYISVIASISYCFSKTFSAEYAYLLRYSPTKTEVGQSWYQ